MNGFGKHDLDEPAMSGLRETIVALSTPPGVSAIALVRLSGPDCRHVLQTIVGQVPVPRVATLVNLRDPLTAEVLDRAMVLWLPGPASYTGEDMVEFHLHGSRAVVTGVIEVLCRLDGVRLAEPGEFTRRAFEAGKLSLSQVEGLGDLLQAETAEQRRQSLAELRGEVDQQAEKLRHDLVAILSHVEALIEFPDEEDAASQMMERQAERVKTIRLQLERALIESRRHAMIREGLQIVIAGPPNAGKSSLLNAFAGSDVAIVSAIPGTTRDVIEVALDLEGVKARLIDTAGLRESEDLVEQEGIRRARLRIEEADLVIFLQDGSQSVDMLRQEADRFVSDMRLLRNDLTIWPLVNKIDDGRLDVDGLNAISVRFGNGMTNLKERLLAWSKDQIGAGPLIITQLRHRQIYTDIVGHLHQAESLLSQELIDLASEHLRSSLGLLGRISGRIGVEEVLDSLFKTFCIGK